MLNGFLRGIFSYFDAYSFIRSNRLQRYYWYSGFIGLCVFVVVIALVMLLSSTLSSFIVSLLNIESSWLATLSQYAAGALVGLLFFILYKYLVLIATAPLMSKLSEEVELIMDGEFISLPFTISQIASDFGRAITLSLRNVFKEIAYTLMLFLVGLLPGLAIGTTPLIFLVQSYFAGFGNIDFYAERHFNARETIDFVKENRSLAAGNGTLYLLLLAIPIIGVFFAPTLGTVAATLECDKRLNP